MKLILAFIIPSIVGGFIIPSDRIFVPIQLELAGFSGFVRATGDIETKETFPTPAFTHTTGSTKQTESASALALSAPASFTGFGHVLDNSEPKSEVPTPSLTGFGHTFANSENTSSDVATPERSLLEIAKASLIQATAKTTILRDVMKLKENQTESRIRQLMGNLQKQEEACRSYELQISSITAEFQGYKTNTGQEQLALEEQEAKKDSEMDSVLAQAKEICDLLDESLDELM